MNKANSKIKVLCAMSGGVDSSVVTALLKKQGFEVLGVFLKFWKPTQSTTNIDTNCHQQFENICCDQEALRSARSVADKLKIPFYVFDVSREFKKEVVDYYISEYDSGRTPNPCVVCNKKIKFGWLIKKAQKLGCDFVATGHYAKLIYPLANGKKMCALQKRPKSFLWRLRPTFCHTARLFSAKDTKKDQSYFFWQLSQGELRHILFPIGDYTKDEVRRMATKWELPVAERKESQDICFVPAGDNQKFLHQYAKKLNQPGKITDLRGQSLGRHQGLINYTIGQRHGLGSLSHMAYRKSSNSKPLAISHQPMYVVKLNIDKNQLIVGEEKNLYSKTLTVKNINWLAGKPPEFNLTYQAKIRYGSTLAKCQLKIENCELKIIFSKPQRAITPGQSVVIYDNKELLGGGIIL